MEPSKFVPKTSIKVLSLFEHAQKFNAENCANENFIEYLKITKEEIFTVYNATIEQSNCKEWMDQRKGRVTASIFKKVFTRMETMRKKDEDPTVLVNEILGRETKYKDDRLANKTWFVM